MENSQLIALSRLTALERQMGVVANNLANVNTNGFKAENIVFEEYLMPVASAEAFKSRDHDLHFVVDDRSIGNFANGPIETTGNQFDVAVQGDGFFVIETDNGERYTRDGAFTLNNQGELVTHNGDRVLGDGGPIVFDPTDTNVTITGDGFISANSGDIGRLRVVSFENPQTLDRQGNNLFSGDGAQDVEQPRITQFALERANIDGISQITQMIQVQRAYSSISNIMRQQNELRETAIQRLGRVEV